MNTIFTQSDRAGRLDTVLGTDVLVLLRFDGVASLNDLFAWHVDCLATTPDIDFDALIGTHATVTITTAGGEDIPFDGIVTEAHWIGPGENGYRYRLTLKAWFYLATLRRNQRIFHDRSVVQILQDVLGAYTDVGAVELKLSRDYPPIEYTVQYRESDFAFACRMMERFGISYHFKHSQEWHIMVLTDRVEAHDTIGERPLRPAVGLHREEIEHFSRWNPARRITTGAIRLTDYNFKTPMAAMLAQQQGDATHARGRTESFDYPGDYLEQGAGKLVASLRMSEERSKDRRYEAGGSVPTLTAGGRVTLTGEDVPGTGAEYVCLTAAHSFSSNSYGTGAESGDGYSGTYVLMPVTAPLLPERTTPLALVHGPQTARVVGDGEIDCDEFGRILVQFHWDLDSAISMRCRVSQNWSGNGWGGMVIPRIGMEVVVEFLEGDPDKPLVTGCVYNGRNRVPYGLPEHKTRSTFKTNTHQGTGYNELRFEDLAGREEVFMHAQKDHNTVIENDETHAIGHDRSKSVARDQSESIGRDKSTAVGHDHGEVIGRDATYRVGRNQIETYGKDHIHNVGNIYSQKIFADHLFDIGRDVEGVVARKFKMDVGTSITNNTGTHTLMAYEKMQIKGPGGKITIDATGITLEAAMIFLKGTVIMGGSGSSQVPVLSLAANQGLPLAEECPPPKKD
jgi:type VI secretion system secreted protein VgrG